MRIFLAGASGVIGVRLVRLLIDSGHEVAGMTRTPEKIEMLGALGADPILCDVFDAHGLRDAVVSFRPQVVMHQLTDLPDDAERIPEREVANARIRREGTRNLLAAADAAGTLRFFAQSVAWDLGGDAGEAVAELERGVLEIGGVVLRYGQFYGPETYHPDEVPPHPRVHIDEAARRTVGALDVPSGVLLLVEK